MAVNKVILNNETLIDLTSDDAVASDVRQGKYFHLADGTRVEGTATGGGGGSTNPYEDVADNQSSGSKGEYLFSNFDGNDASFGNYYTAELKAKIQTLVGLFRGCVNLTGISLADLLTSYQGFSGNIDLTDTFAGCSSLASLSFANTILDYTVDSAVVTGLERAFFGCETLTALDLSDVVFDNNTYFNLNNTFAGCTDLASLTWFANINQGLKVLSAVQTFFGDEGLTSLDLTRWNFQYGANAYAIFGACENLASLTLPQSFIWAMNSEMMFYDCQNLTAITYNGSKASWKSGNYVGIFGNCAITQTIVVTCTDGTFTYTYDSLGQYYVVTESVDPLVNGYYANELNGSDYFYLDALNEEITYQGNTYSYTQSGTTLDVQTLGQMEIIDANQVIFYNGSNWLYTISPFTLINGTYIGSDSSSWTLDIPNSLATDENQNSYSFSQGSGLLVIETSPETVFNITSDTTFETPDGTVTYSLQAYHLQDGQYNKTQGSGSNYYIIDTQNLTATNSNNQTRSYVDNGDSTFTMDKGSGNYETYILLDDYTFQNIAGTTIYAMTPPV